MAGANNKTALRFMLVLTLSLLLIISMADGRLSGTFGSTEKDVTVTCTVAHGVEEGETCSSVAQQANISAVLFSLMNPNLDCDNLFVGQWLCVA